MTESFRAIVIGGGVAGTSIAYHLAAAGWSDSVLLERSELTSGSTFHSAGLVGQLRSSVTLTRMMMYSVGLYRQLRAETGVDPGWHEVGSLRLASSEPRRQELRRLSGWGETFGLPLEIVPTERALEMWPLIDPAGVLEAAWLPTDGHVDPSGLVFALAEGAKRGGVEIRTGTRVTAIDVHRGHVRGVRTDAGDLHADVVVNAGGMYAHQIGRLAGVEIPIVPFEHQYLVTEPIRGVSPEIPTMRDPDRLVYFRGDAGGTLVAGGYERRPAPWNVDDGPPADFNHRLLPEDWERFGPLAEQMQALVPALREAGVVRMINGPEAFSPDGEFVMGETDVSGLYVATGFGAHGIAGAGGVGKVIAEWVAHGEPEWDMWRMDVRRLGAHYRSRRYAEARAYEVYATNYDIHYPGEERTAGRPLKMAPTYGRLAELGATFGEKSGWERANWFRSNEDPSHEDRRPRGWAGEHWSTAIVTEHLACRERVALFDESSFAKIEVDGPGSVAFLQWICARDIDRSVGAVTYTQLLNARGGIECDLTVTRLGEDRFRLVTGTAFGNHDLGWIRRRMEGRDDVHVRDVTGAYGCLGLWGPLAREVLTPLTPADLSNGAFPYMSAQEIVVGDAPCLAQRVTYVGELGWELFVPAELALSLLDTLLEAGEAHGIVPAGYRAIDSLRLEKGYLAWGADITPEEDPFQAGLGSVVDMDREFFGREALLGRRAQNRPTLTVLFLEDPHAMVLGNEPVFDRRRVVARVTSGGIGYAVDRSIALAYLATDLTVPGQELSVDVFGERVPAIVANGPAWDPKGERIRA
jgi:glycine cleavage system aminomethyltransferase T/glycine/D-amino acid oxidase-like deaminating enzyme